MVSMQRVSMAGDAPPVTGFDVIAEDAIGLTAKRSFVSTSVTPRHFACCRDSDVAIGCSERCRRGQGRGRRRRGLGWGGQMHFSGIQGGAIAAFAAPLTTTFLDCQALESPPPALDG